MVKKKSGIQLKRAKNNPIIKPRRYKWEWRTLNPGVILLQGKIHILYRAGSAVGYAATHDGEKITERLSRPIYIPKEKYDEGKGYTSAEDPRLTRIGNRIYMTYTSFEGDFSSIKMAFTSIKVADFLKKKWNWREPVLMTRPGQRHKNFVIFPKKIKNKIAILHKIAPKIEVKYLDNLDKYFNGKRFIKSVYRKTLRHKVWDSYVRGAGPPPLKTELGWLLLYHAIQKKDPRRFKLGAMILDIKNPTKILYRSVGPILAPDKPYENRFRRKGSKGKSGVVYATGAVIKDSKLFVYYGGADSVVCVASVNLDDLLNSLKNHKVVK